MDWARMLAYVTGTVDQELLARNEYVTAENRILKAQLNGRSKLSDAERSTLGEIGHRLGRTALAEVATVAKPDTIVAWYRKLVAHKFDGSKARRGPGRPRLIVAAGNPLGIAAVEDVVASSARFINRQRGSG
jgi:putative transposase